MTERTGAARAARPRNDPTTTGWRDLVCDIDHVGIAVRDLDAALATYSALVGARVVHDEVNDDQGVREVMLAVGSPADGSPPDGSPPDRSGCGRGGTRLQLLGSLREDSPVASFLRRRGEGVQHVAYAVRDIEQVSAALRARGVTPIYDRPRPGTAGSRVNFVHPHDAHGVLVELVQPATSRESGPGPADEPS